MKILETNKGTFKISTDKEKLDLSYIHAFLAKESQWARNIPLPVVEKSVKNALCFGIYNKERQVGFARVISDFATIAYLGDVFVDKQFRGLGLSKWLMETILSHEELQNMRRWILVTKDAHKLYEKFNFRTVPDPHMYMELANPDVYRH